MTIPHIYLRMLNLETKKSQKTKYEMRDKTWHDRLKESLIDRL